MKLTAKLVAAIVLGMVILLSAVTGFSLNRAQARYEADSRRHTDLIGRLMTRLLLDEWRSNGLEHALRAVHASNRPDQLVQFRWIWLSEHAEASYQAQLPFDRLGAVLHGETLSIEWADREGRHLLTYVPLEIAGERPAALEITESLAPFGHRTVILAAGLALVGGVAATLVGFGMIGRPLQRLTDRVRRAGTDELGGPLPRKGGDELAELAVSIDAICDGLVTAKAKVQAETAARIKVLEQLRHADRLATVGMLASGAAHELGSPMMVISGRAEMIARGDLPQGGTRENAVIIKSQAERVTQVVRELLSFARREAPSRTRVNVLDLIHETVHLLSALARKNGAEIRICSPPRLPEISADRRQLQQVFANLLVNAMQAMPRGGEVVLKAEAQAGPAAPGRWYVRVDVRDQGQGIPPEHQQRIFDPFFTTKDVDEGTGLGLSIAKGIIKEHGGWIDVSSEPGRGACFSVFLPMEDAPCVDG